MSKKKTTRKKKQVIKYYQGVEVYVNKEAFDMCEIERVDGKPFWKRREESIYYFFCNTKDVKASEVFNTIEAYRIHKLLERVEALEAPRRKWWQICK